MIKYVRGAIWWANLDDPGIRETRAVQKNRPVLIMSNNQYNSTHSTLTVLPITHSVPGDNEKNFRVAIDTSSPDKQDTSYVMCDQIRLIDKKDLDNFYGLVSDWEMINIQAILVGYLDIDLSSYKSAEDE